MKTSWCMALAVVLGCEEKNVAENEGWSKQGRKGRIEKPGKGMGGADAQNVLTRGTPWRDTLEDDAEGPSDAACWGFLVIAPWAPHKRLLAFSTLGSFSCPGTYNYRIPRVTTRCIGPSWVWKSGIVSRQPAEVRKFALFYHFLLLSSFFSFPGSFLFLSFHPSFASFSFATYQPGASLYASPFLYNYRLTSRFRTQVREYFSCW